MKKKKICKGAEVKYSIAKLKVTGNNIQSIANFKSMIGRERFPRKYRSTTLYTTLELYFVIIKEGL